MFEKINQNLCTAGDAYEYPEPLWRDKNGNVVESKENIIGLKSRYGLISPDWLLFVDECGSNTLQAKDGQASTMVGNKLKTLILLF